MKDTGKRLKTVVAALLFLVTSCQKEVVPEEPRAEAPIEEQGSQASELELGEQLENPYSVANMQKALASLQKSKKHAETAKRKKIKATHLYIKFSPQTEKELDLLKQDSTLILYDYPLDRNITKQGDSYRDPTVPKDRPTPQYTAVPVDKALPGGVRHKVLEKLYIPDGDGDVETTGKGLDQSLKTFIYDLVDESLRLTGNLSEEELADPLSARRRKWRPAGTIRVWDDKFGRLVPVAGVKVRARRWFTTRTGIANASGRYSCDGRFRRKANYSIKWDRYEYSIRSGKSGQATFNGPKRRGDWNVDFEDNSLQQFYAFIHLACLQYYYGDIKELKRPPMNAVFRSQMKIAGMNENGRANHNKNRRFLGIGSWLHMYRYEDNDNVTVERLYSTMLHELAHASHWELRRNNWSGGRTSDKLQESWAVVVSAELTRSRYPNHLSSVESYNNRAISFNEMVSWGESRYTPYFLDLMDNTNQGLTNRTRPFDRVSGYTLPEMESVLSNSGNLQNVSDNLRSRYDNATEGLLQELTTQYINLRR